MMADQRWLDLKELIDEMLQEPLVGPGELAVRGGAFRASELERFLLSWALPRQGMPWGLWQWTDCMEMQHGRGMPGDLEHIERGRVFGPEGDLEIRRERDEFLWRFVGEAATAMALGFEAADYWSGREGKPLRAFRRTALLWGSRKAARQHGKPGWHEDRVSQAGLDYPEVSSDRAQIRYVEYLDGGNVEWVRFTALEDKVDGSQGGDDA